MPNSFRPIQQDVQTMYKNAETIVAITTTVVGERILLIAMLSIIVIHSFLLYLKVPRYNRIMLMHGHLQYSNYHGNTSAVIQKLHDAMSHSIVRVTKRGHLTFGISASEQNPDILHGQHLPISVEVVMILIPNKLGAQEN